MSFGDGLVRLSNFIPSAANVTVQATHMDLMQVANSKQLATPVSISAGDPTTTLADKMHEAGQVSRHLL